MKFSIIVPVYNVEKELSRCLDSIINQTYKNLEIIVIDDGSTDSSSMICDEYLKKDDRIIVIHKKNGGLSSARNEGIKKATGDYLLFVDSDDYIELETCKNFFDVCSKQNYDIIIGNAIEIHNDKIVTYKHKIFETQDLYSGNDYIYHSIKHNEFYAPAWLNAYSCQYILKNNLYFKEGILHEDMEYLPRVFLPAKKIGYMNFEFYNYIIRENSITQTKKTQKNIEHLLEIYSDWKILFDKIENKKTQKMLYAVLTKYYIASCRKFHYSSEKMPKGVSKKFLILHTLNIKEFIKTLLFLINPKFYVGG